MSEINRKVLCVDDEPNVLDGLRRQLRGQCALTCAVGVEAGLAALQNDGPFGVVVADYRMPGMTGAEFLANVRRIAPDTVTVMLTGCQELEVAVKALHDGRVFRFLNKPCPREVLQCAIRDSLEQHRLVTSERRLTGALQDANEKLNSLNADLEDRVRERTATIARLYDFVSELGGKDGVKDVAELVAHTAAELLRSKRAAVLLSDSSGEYSAITAAIGVSPETCDGIRIPNGIPLLERIFAENRATVIDASDEAALANACRLPEIFAARPLAAAPLAQGGRTVGVLGVSDPWSAEPYDATSLATLQAIAETSSVALLNQIRLEERNEARDAVILALAKLAEHRDPETGAHLERVQVYCRLLSETLARTPRFARHISPGFITTIVRSSPLHDIGKVGIPDRILLKPGKLTPPEFEVMKTHTTIGADTIRGLLTRRRGQEFLQMGYEIALNHHEQFDGTGYPAGIAGEQIPLPARIMALADVYDALRSRRVYKPPMSHSQALDIIRKGTGKHFDPDVVAAFMDRHDEYDRLASELADEGNDESMVPTTTSNSPLEAHTR